MSQENNGPERFTWIKTNEILRGDRVETPCVLFARHIYTFGSRNYLRRTPGRQRIYGVYSQRVYEFDTDSLTFTRIFYKTPKKIYERTSATAVLYGSYVYLYGGQKQKPTPRIDDGTIARFNLRTTEWDFPQTTNPPPELEGHSACVIGNTMYVYAGVCQDGDVPNPNIYTLNLVNLSWNVIDLKAKNFPFRSRHSACEFNGHMYVWGGTCTFDNLYFSAPHFEDSYVPTESPFPDAEENSKRDEIHKDEFYRNVGGAQEWTAEDEEALHADDDIDIDSDEEREVITQVVRDTQIYKYSPETNSWELFPGPGGCLRNLQDHQMAVHNDSIVIFGGVAYERVHNTDCATCKMRCRKNEVYLYTPSEDSWKDLSPKRLRNRASSPFSCYFRSTVCIGWCRLNNTRILYIKLELSLVEITAVALAEMETSVSCLPRQLQTYVKKIKSY